MLINMTVEELLEKTAANTPVPGGGSIAALSGASAAALTEMVANLTIGKKNYEEVTLRMAEIAREAATLRHDLLAAVDQDADSYAKVMDAYQLPKETPEEKEVRTAQIQAAFQLAAAIPMMVAQKSRTIFDLAGEVVEKGNQNARTDGSVAKLLAKSAAKSAIYNVNINLESIKDQEFVAKFQNAIKAIGDADDWISG